MAGALVALVMALSGCVGISAILTPSQPASMGPVTLSVQICANGHPDCLTTANTESTWTQIGANSIDAQLLYAVRLPNGATPSVPSSNPGLTWFRSLEYENELQALEPAPAGQRWWGWISSAFTYSSASVQSARIDVTVALPLSPSGAPTASPLPWRPVVGARIVNAADPALPADRPVECGSTNAHLYSQFAEDAPDMQVDVKSVTCIDSPNPVTTRTSEQAHITDFGVRGTATEGPAGSRIGVPFTIERSGPAKGADAAVTFALSATGGPPGATLSLSTATAPLSAAATQVVVNADVPANVTLGDYPVTLTATAPGKPQRSATTVLRVVAPTPPAPPAGETPTTPPPPPPPPPPTADTTAPVILSLRISKNPFRRGTAKPVTLTTRSTEGGTKAVLVQRLLPGRRVGSACRTSARTGRACQVVKRVRTVRRATTGVAAVKLAGAGITRLAPGRYRAEVRVTDAAGNRSAPKRLLFTVRR